MSLPSAEVAADFRDALEDLKVNSRPEISNLTVIAKENTEHAQAISRELENHIKQTRPEWKLPALYVLDSIVKNVGTPYTVYLGRNLYNTFMLSYTLVDDNTRRAMEGLLKTWKQPVPESLDTRPVFPADVTREIENALIKYRTNLAIKQQQNQARMPRPGYGAMPSRGPQSTGAYRNTPTPPQVGGQWQLPNAQQSVAGQGSSNISQDPRRPQKYQMLQQDPAVRSPVFSAAIPATNGNAGFLQQPSRLGTPPQHSTPMPALSATVLNNLLQTVSTLISSAEARLATGTADSRTAELLDTLRQLQTILKTQQLTPDAISSIQNEVARIAESFNHQIPHPTPTPQSFGGQPNALPMNVAQLAHFLPSLATPQPMAATPASAATISNLPIAQLLQHLAPTSTPPIPTASSLPVPPPAITPSLMQPTPTPTPSAGTPDLFAALRAAGLLPSTPVPPPLSGAPHLAANQPARSPLSELRNDVQINATSLKIPRPHLIEKLYGAKPNQCRQCARRFTNDDTGREKKQKHMDWHFNVNTRLAQNSKSVINRSWYIDEMEWISYRESDDSSSSTADSPKSKAKAKDPKEQYVPVPTDPALANATCPICQEKFETVWHQEAEQPVWMDAVIVAGRTYHATCYAEVSKGAVQGQREETPLLGKRKWEG